MNTPDPTEYLLSRYAEDEAVARTAAHGGRWHYSPGDSVGAWTLYDDKWTIASLRTYRHEDRPHPAYYVDADANGEHIARHDPARVLAGIKAKRAVVAAHPVHLRDLLLPLQRLRQALRPGDVPVRHPARPAAGVRRPRGLPRRVEDDVSCFMHRMTWTYDGRTETGTCAGCGRTTVRHWIRRHHGGYWEGPRSPHEPPWSLLAGEWILTNPGWWPAMKR